MKLRSLILSFACACSLACAGLAMWTVPAYAQVDTGLNAVGQTIKLPNTDPRVIVVRIINTALGVIGIIVVALMLYAGFLYMTAGGDAEKVGKAKKIIINCIIGLAIILSSWAITRFILDRLLQATQGGEVSGGGGSSYIGGFGGGTGTSFRVKSITPQGDTPLKPRNTEVKIVFTKPVDDTSASAITVIKDGGTTVGGTIGVVGQLVTFTPQQNCPAPNSDRKCFDSNSGFTIKVGTTVKSSLGQTLTCGGFAPSCQAHFSTSDLVDTQPPVVNISYPADGMPVQQNYLVDVLAHATDDSGVATVEFFDGTKSLGVDGPNATSTPLNFDAKAQWDTTGAALGPHVLSASARDLDTNTSKSPSISVVVRAEHCFNSKLDADKGETGIDCGGDSNSLDYCGACSGGACTANTQCSSGFCIDGKCANKPVIKSVDPQNGKAGTYVTITGANFGFTPGTVTFVGNPNSTADDKVAQPPAACVAAGARVWSNSQAIVAVPDGAASGPIEIKNAESQLTDRTNTDPGPAIPDFLVDNTAHPGLCAFNPSGDIVGKEADALGQGFGLSSGKIWFGSDDYLLTASPWDDAKVHFRIPVVDNGPYNVKIRTAANGDSNAVEFDVLEKYLDQPPELDSLDPVTGPQQEYVTLYGKHFGFSVGTVIFSTPLQDAVGDTSFPDACAAGFWRDDTIVIKVPSIFKNSQPTTSGTYQIKVVRADGAQTNALQFQLDTTLTAKPGICAIDPPVGPMGTRVKISGDRFGFILPTLTFTPNKFATVDSNTMQAISSSVPKDASTGPVAVTSQGIKSNGVNFQVRNCNEAPDICGPADRFQCCPSGECRALNDRCGQVSLKAQYAWQMSTGLIPLAPYVIEECAPDANTPPTPSPSPWLNRAGGDQAPVDAEVKMRFSQELDPSSVTPHAFRFLKCTSTKTDPCATTEPVDYVLHPLIDENGSQSVVTLAPNFKLATSTTYLVNVSTGIKGAGQTGAKMVQMKSCGTGLDAETYGYCFRFRTRSTTEPSQVGSIGVSPHSFTFTDTGKSTNYEAEPTYANDRCIVLNCDLYNWDWHAGDARGYVTNNKGGNNNYGYCEQQGTGVAETGNVPVDIIANLASTALTGTGYMYVLFLPPQVVDYAPKCDAACSNALVWARFSTKVDPLSVYRTDNVKVQKCYNENCFDSELGPALAASGIKLDDDGLTLEFSHADLEPGAFYKVLLRGGANAIDPISKENIGITGANGVPLAGTNSPLGFAWTFRVKQGADAHCKVDRVDVKPVEKFETVVGASQIFAALPFSKADTCSADGQRLVTTGGTLWDSSDKQVANFVSPLARTDTSKLPLGCTANCQAAGSGGLFGKTAVCGNKLIETTDSGYCKTPAGSNQGLTPKGDPCTLLAPGAAAGEECEPSIDGTDSCNINTCLWKPVPLVTAGGTCGNGIADYGKGEACDYGLTCVGGSVATDTTPVAEYAPCNTQADKQTCENAHGTCTTHDYRGCSASCRHLGAKAGRTSCGNGDRLGDGKDCDDGNITDGDGCSADCLHEASKPSTQLSAVCGNGILEPGETCEATLVHGLSVFPSGCDSIKCVHMGVLPCATGQTSACCGDNNANEPGKDCDEGALNGLGGCSKTCLLQGSSPAYINVLGEMAPSFCGDGVLGRGEQCEISRSSDQVVNQKLNPTDNGRVGSPSTLGVDSRQLAFIVGNEQPDETTGRASSTLSAVLMEQTGIATYGLQCGFTAEMSCVVPGSTVAMGLDTNGCCRARPALLRGFPNPSPPVCRNVQIQIEFVSPMDVSSVVNNFQIAEQTGASTCPSGTKLISEAPPIHGLWNQIKDWWHKLIAWFRGQPVMAQKWCVGGVSGQLVPLGDAKTSRTYGFNLDHVLDPNASYKVILKGDANLSDNGDVNNRTGIKTVNGVVSNGDIAWTFQTNGQICALNVVNISDTTQDPQGHKHPYLYLNECPNSATAHCPETRVFSAEADSLQNGQAIALSSTDEYQWKWGVWTSSDKNLVYYASGHYAPSGTYAIPAWFTSQQPGGTQRNGTAILTAEIQVATDTVNVPPTVGQVIQGVAPVSVLVCENPWPSLSHTPFEDTQDWQSTAFKDIFKTVSPFASDKNFYNFSTMYCRDAGEAHNTDDDLPGLNINPVATSTIDTANGVLRQYLFTYDMDMKRPDLKSDGIGIRIMQNPDHLSPAAWYASKRFMGQPTNTTVDGYPALVDGNTVYVAAANQPNIDGPIYSNIYIISHNPDAQPETLEIYKQMLQYLTFNINVQNQSNTCHVVSGNQYSLSLPYTDSLDLPIACTTDWQCVNATGTHNLFCDANKLKMARDTQRIADFQALNSSLAGGKDAQSLYPQLTSGTFVKGLSTSLWPSWTDQLSGALGSKKLPQDPVNHYVTCGKCQDGSMCQTDADCGGQAVTTTCMGGTAQSGSWMPNPDIDPQTCWDSKTFQYVCPQYDAANPFSVSRLYQYQVLNGGSQFQLSSEFEVHPLTAAGTDWWYPPLPTIEFKCVATSTSGQYCMDASDKPNDSLCRLCQNPAGDGTCKICKLSGLDCSTDADCPGKNDSCQQVTLDWPTPIRGACRPFGGSFQYSGICKNQLVAENGTCGDGVLNTNNGEICELGDTQSQACCTKGQGNCSKNDGHQQYACLACKGWAVDSKHPQCIPDVQCGNGRIDKHCANTPAQGCTSDSDCPAINRRTPDTCVNAEVCDDGVLNGSYGHCSTDCQHYGGFCGNDQLDAGESCDNGIHNGEWHSSKVPVGPYPLSCGFDCKSAGPYCGDQIVNGAEECDGQTQTSQRAICSDGITLCDTSADCPNNGSCGGSLPVISGDVRQAFSRLAQASGGLAASFVSNFLPSQALAATFEINNLGTKTNVGTLNSGLQATTLNGVNNTPQSVQTTVTPAQTTPIAPIAPTQTPTTINSVEAPVTPVQTPTGNQPQSIQIGGGNDGGGLGQLSSNPPLINLIDVCDHSTPTYDDHLTHLWNSSCANLTVTVGGIKRQTQHVRTCGAPASSNACMWNCWSACQPVGICGDGIINSGEECDDGANNGSTKPCLPTCKKNVCGDGFVNAGVEECDSGAQNGSVTCNADYNSTCLSCSKLCKFMASAGGYCGDGIKNGPEQCDGEEGLIKLNGVKLANPITCQQLGYDYGDCKLIKTDILGLNTSFAPDCSPTVKNQATCTNACGFGGCHKCSDEAGTGMIQGRVYDMLFQQVVPNARVTLMYKGVKVDEVQTDDRGVFTFKTLNGNGECASYKIVVDMYQDNPCTNKDRKGMDCASDITPAWSYPYDIDESKNGGYFPFTSDAFSFGDYLATTTSKIYNGVDEDWIPHFDILPKPERGMAYMALLWDNPKGFPNHGTGYAIHTVLPSEAASTLVNWDKGETSEKCDYANNTAYSSSAGYNTACIRDINTRAAGDWDVTRLPFVRMICLHRANEFTDGWADAGSNGCPLIGTDKCLQSYNKIHNTLLTSLGCKSSSDPGCAACGAMSNKSCPTDDGLLGSCNQLLYYSPVTSLVNYKLIDNSSGKIKFYVFWGADNGQTGLQRDILNYNARAYAVLTDMSGNSSVKLISKPTDSGWAWHVADLDINNQSMDKVNSLEGKNDTNEQEKVVEAMPDTPKSSVDSMLDGIGSWSVWFQAANTGYCVDITRTKLKPTVGMNCYVSVCNNGYSCGTLTQESFDKYNW